MHALVQVHIRIRRSTGFARFKHAISKKLKFEFNLLKIWYDILSYVKAYFILTYLYKYFD